MMFMDFWQICQEYWLPEDDDEYWQAVLDDTDRFCRKYGNDTFPRGLAMALIGNLEEGVKMKNNMRKE